jgi:hypothetical protein
MYALVADGKNGLRILQMISPENVPGHMGFSPPPNSKLIATFPTKGPAVAVSRGLDRDRVADESGNQTVVFGRRGSRPFNLAEMQKLYSRSNSVYTVEDTVARDGKLQTTSGTALEPANQFKPPADESRVIEANNNRLIRRGR